MNIYRWQNLVQRLQTPRCVSLNVPEHSLDIDDGLGVCHVVLLGAHCALFVHNHQVVCVDYATLQEVVQAGAFRKQGITD